ncbi:MAG: hypothetical protein NVS3B16_23430 [Vulcanimicrobiaceae bacterium]
MIAVGGDSGSGKATLCRGLSRIFGDERIATMCLDDYHSLDRAQRASVGLTALDPRANNFAAIEEDLWAIREGRAIDKPVYDHATGTFGGSERVEPTEIVAVYGLFPLYTRALRSLFDVTVWLDPETELKTAWKIERDTRSRGYAEAAVRAEIASRTLDFERYIQPQIKHADLTVRFSRPNDWAAHGDAAKLNGRIRKGGRFRPLDYAEFESASTSIRFSETASGGFPETIIDLDGRIAASTADALQARLWSHLAMNRPRPAGIGEFVAADGRPRIGPALALAQVLIARRVVLIEQELLQMAP